MSTTRWIPLGIALLGIAASIALATSRPPLETSPVPDRRPLVAVTVATPTDIQVIVRSQGSVEPRIEIEISDEGRAHRLTVRDNGKGIDPEHHQRIFEIFHSLGPRSDGHPSTGIGLAIVKKIAETRGGSVTVDSRPGQGTAFHVLLSKN